MTCSIRILTTFTLDSSPAILLVSPNGDSTLINCGEGCQRSFLESPGLRTRSIKRVCLTHIAHDAIGGLPGMVLTTSDVAIAAAAAQASLQGATPTKRMASSEEDDVPGLDIVGPMGTQAFLHSLRHFMRRDKFQMRVKEGAYHQRPGDASTSKPSNKRKKGAPIADPEGFYVQTIPLVHRWSRNSPAGATVETQVLSFVFTTPPVLGKFLPDKASELGVPPGPLYSKLKAGQSVTVVDGQGVEKTIESHQVVTKGSPGVSAATVYCPSFHVLEQLRESPAWNRFVHRKDDTPVLDVMLHMTSHSLFCSAGYRAWMRTFPTDVDHVFLESVEYLADLGDRISNARDSDSPFRAGELGAMTRSLIHKDIYPSPLSLRSNGTEHDNGSSPVAKDDERPPESDLSVIYGKPMMDYRLIPRSKKGIVTNSIDTTDQDRNEATSFAVESGAVELAKSTIAGLAESCPDGNCSSSNGELIFTGTGSAIPCKQRNVTGMYLQMKNGNGMFLDVGEGTFGQLLRAKQSGADFRKLLQSIKAVWISHPHADHHLGLLRFLTERNSIHGFGTDPIVLMAPPNMFAFLDEYCAIDPSMNGSYIPFDCRDMQPHAVNPLGDKLYRDLGITHCVSIPVAHCPHSYAVIIDGTPFGRLAYSGDCRPSTTFADAAVNADLLIHEATFEDGMEEEATLKRHCTVGEALMIGRRMRARAVALTHFSQRYPRIPPVNQLETGQTPTAATGQSTEVALPRTKHDPTHVVFAFDFMKLTPDTLSVASALTPALRLLYPSDEEEPEDNDKTQDEPPRVSLASEILSVPGLFAQKDIL